MLDTFIKRCGFWAEVQATIPNTSNVITVGICLDSDSLFSSYLYFIKDDQVIGLFLIDCFVVSTISDCKEVITFKGYDDYQVNLIYPSMNDCYLIHSQICVCRKISRGQASEMSRDLNESFLEQFGKKYDSELCRYDETVPLFPVGFTELATETWKRRTEMQNYHYFHELKDFNIEIVTWNVGQRHPEEDTDEMMRDLFNKDVKLILIVLEEIDFSPTAVILGTSDLCQKWGDVFDKADEMKRYEKVFEDSLGGVYMRIVRLKDTKEIISVQDTKYIRLGSNGLTANKSAILCCLSIDSIKFIFTGCHLIPHNENNQERNIEISYIINEIEKFQADYSVITGDLNYRLEMESKKVVQLILENNIQSLLEKDQLNNSKVENQLLSLYDEEEITFQPSYKFLPESSEYDITRIPSWTDRVLVHFANPNLTIGLNDDLFFETDIIRLSELKTKFYTEPYFSMSELPKNFPCKPICKSYISYQNNQFSDHRPVSAIYSFSIPTVIDDKFKKFMKIRTKKYEEIIQLSFPKCEINPKSFDIDTSKEITLSNISCKIINWKVDNLPENVELIPNNGTLYPSKDVILTVKCFKKLEKRQFISLDIEGIPLFFEFWPKEMIV